MAAPAVFLTFDVEEFDLPVEYHQVITMHEQVEIGMNGLTAITPLLNRNNIECTLFTTANFAEHFPAAIKELSNQHEIASHTFYHSSFCNDDLLLSKQKLEEITGKQVIGLRMPRLREVAVSKVKKAGYVYDSSINPTYIPGRYNKLNLPKRIYGDDGLIRVPTAVTPNFRIPLFWLMFKNAPYILYKNWALQTLKRYGYLSLYFHPWEFTDISSYKLPSYIVKPCGEVLLDKLYKLLEDLQKEGSEFVSIDNYLKNNNTPILSSAHS
jgi:peptidoglycan/xylan/chitin deacetylase (PgdA/CDA1 family)